MGQLALDSIGYLLTRYCSRKWKQMLVGGGACLGGWFVVRLSRWRSVVRLFKGYLG